MLLGALAVRPGADLPVEDGLVGMDRKGDVCQIAVVERHRGTGKVTNAFVSGFGYTEECAMATSVAFAPLRIGSAAPLAGSISRTS